MQTNWRYFVLKINLPSIREAIDAEPDEFKDELLVDLS